jgi:hypothetical protein
MKLYRLFPTCISALALAGCVGTEVGNPQDGSEVTVEFRVETPQDPRALTFSNGIDIDSFWVAIEEVGLVETAACEESERFDDELPFAVELVEGIEVPDSPMLKQSAIDFCKLEIEVDDSIALVSPAPDELLGRSLLVRGTLPDATPFEFRSNVADTIALEGELRAQGATRLLVSFDIDNLFAPEDFESLEPVDGVVVLDAETDEETTSRISQAFLASATLVRDDNDNGVVDPEDTVIATSEELEDNE